MIVICHPAKFTQCEEWCRLTVGKKEKDELCKALVKARTRGRDGPVGAKTLETLPS